MNHFRLLLVLLLATSGAAPLAAQAAAQDSAAGPLGSLRFMAGCWRGAFANGVALEEQYTTPSANLILGMSRFMRGDSAVQHEFSRITTDSAGVVVLQPFPNGRPSEHGFRLTQSEDGSALFEAPAHDFPKRIRYTRGTDGSLTARIDGGAGDTRVQEWRMEPALCTTRRER